MKEIKEHNKLIRDNIPDILIKKDINCKFHIADNKEFENSLYDKLIYELQEFKNNPCVDELADMLEVIDAIRSFHKISLDELKSVKLKKYQELGSFRRQIILDTTEE